MYKTKLQELCHQKRWGLPKYSAMKDGPDHLPRFKASVFVNGLTFTSSTSFSSSNQAYNHAAKLAFLNFSSPSPGSSKPTAECDEKQPFGAEKPQVLHVQTKSSMIINDMDRLSKSQQQDYRQRNNLNRPIYTTKIEEPAHPHAIVDGKSLESAAFFNAIKEAEQAAAKVALMSLSLDMFEKGDYGSCKNLLLEFTQKKGLCKPTYKTVQFGSHHKPTFFSTVQVDGKVFHGKAGKSKKQAEHDAAKVAYIALRQCKLNMDSALLADFIENKAIQSIHSSGTLKSKHSLKHEDEPKELHNPSIVAPLKEQDMKSNKSFSSCESQ